MKKLALILIAAIGFYGFQHREYTHASPHASIYDSVQYVYICNSNTAYAYHSSETCRGLNRCTHGVKKITLTEAVKTYHRQPCKICE